MKLNKAIELLEKGKAITLGQRGWYIKLDPNAACKIMLNYYYKRTDKKINRSITIEELENSRWSEYKK